MTQYAPPPYNINYAAHSPTRDADHLKVLAICWYIWSGLAAFFAFIPLIYLGLGIAFLSGAFPAGGGTAPNEARFMGTFFIILGSVAFLIASTMAFLYFMTARSIAQRRRRTLCLVVSGLACLNIPIGITLGIFTFVVLLRPSMPELFAQST